MSPESINKTITRLEQTLEVDLEYGLIEQNPANGKRRRMKAAKASRPSLERSERIAASLDASPTRSRTPTKAIGRRWAFRA